jgi:hypothetical protein
MAIVNEMQALEQKPFHHQDTKAPRKSEKNLIFLKTLFRPSWFLGVLVVQIGLFFIFWVPLHLTESPYANK